MSNMCATTSTQTVRCQHCDTATVYQLWWKRSPARVAEWNGDRERERDGKLRENNKYNIFSVISFPRVFHMRFYSHIVSIHLLNMASRGNCVVLELRFGEKRVLFSLSKYIDKFGTEHKWILLSVESTDRVLKTSGIESIFSFMCQRVWVWRLYLRKLIVISLRTWPAARRSLSVKVSAIKSSHVPGAFRFSSFGYMELVNLDQFCHTQWNWIDQFAFNSFEWAIFCNIID